MKQLISNYSINNTAKTITLPDFTTLVKERLLLITNTTTQTSVYQFNTSSGVTVSGNVITFTGTFLPANTDTLQIYYDTKQGDPHYDDYQLIADVASNNVVQTGTITAADTGSTTSAGQGSQTLIAGIPTAASNVSLNIPVVNGAAESFSNVVLFISGTFTGTYTLERSPDNGTTWTAFGCFIAGTADTVQSGTLPGMFHGNAAGVTNIRVRATALSSGSISVRMQVGIGTGTITVGNPIRLYDTVSKVQATIKAASTAPVSTDTSIIVSESPNSPLVANTTGLATLTAQNTGNASLSAISTNTGRIPVQGAAATAASTPVNIASDQVVSVKGSFVEQTGLSASALNADLVVSTDVSQYKWLSLQVNGTFTGTVTFQASNDNTNWFTTPLMNVVNAVATTSNGASSAGMYIGPVNFRYFRARMTAFTSGTATGVIEFYTHPSVLSNMGVAAAQNGTWTVGLSAGTNTVGSFVQAPLATSTGLTSFQNTAVAATAVTVKASAGRLHRITIQNPNTSIAWLQVFNATAPTVGTTTPVMSIPVPASGIFEDFYPISDTFGTAITIAATTTPTGSTANATALFVSLGYI